MEKNNQKCYFCGSLEKSSNIGTHIDNGVTYVLHECPRCRVQYWTPFKNPGAEWYENDERYKNANNNPVEEPTWSHRKIISFLAPFSGRVFDIGCGTGNFLKWAKSKGWDVTGIDFDSNAINSAEINFLLPNIELSTLENYVEKHRNECTKYDLVTFFDVFEHIDNHHIFLEQVAGMLRPNGYIAMSMPYRLGSRWLQPNDLPPRHLTRWDEKSLKNFLEQKGFNVEYTKRIPASLFYIIMKLRFKYGKLFSFDLINKIQKNQKIKSDKDDPGKKQVDKKIKIRIIHNLAKIKDVGIFGIPALFIWLAMFFTSKRYISLFVIAKKKKQQ